jgi:hypothetical protein
MEGDEDAASPDCEQDQHDEPSDFADGAELARPDRKNVSKDAEREEKASPFPWSQEEHSHLTINPTSLSQPYRLGRSAALTAARVTVTVILVIVTAILYIDCFTCYPD